MTSFFDVPVVPLSFHLLHVYFTLQEYAEREAWQAELDAYLSSEELNEERAAEYEMTMTRAAEFDEWLAKNDDDTCGDMV